MSYEILLGTDAPSLTGSITDSVETGMRELGLDMADGYAERLGLNGVRELVKIAKEGLPPVTPEEWRAYQTLFPVAYFMGKVESRPHFNSQSVFIPTSSDECVAWPMTEYGFNIPPLPVLELWTELWERKVFPGFIVLTPESRRNTDPLLFGEKAGRRFLLARWAEGALMPLEELMKQARAIWEERADARKNGPKCICGCGRGAPKEVPRVKLVTSFPKDPFDWRGYGPTTQLGMLRPECAERLLGIAVPETP